MTIREREIFNDNDFSQSVQIEPVTLDAFGFIYSYLNNKNDSLGSEKIMCDTL